MLTRLLHNIGYVPGNENYNTPEQIQAAMAKGNLLTFDGVYANVYAHRRIFDVRTEGVPRPVLFISGNYVGGDNFFDRGMPPEMFATWDQVISMADEYDLEIGWHSRDHVNLTQIKNEHDLRREIKPPFPMDCFAYPYGAHDKRVRDIVAEYFDEAYAVNEGDDSQYQRLRYYL